MPRNTDLTKYRRLRERKCPECGGELEMLEESDELPDGCVVGCGCPSGFKKVVMFTDNLWTHWMNRLAKGAEG